MDSLKSSSDYLYYYSYCGYSATYGRSGSGDFPYNLDRPLTYFTINSLYIRFGADGPENYARILWEMLNDPTIGWRSCCTRFVIFWLDNIPYARDLYNPSRPYSAYTGTDPGRDAIAGT